MTHTLETTGIARVVGRALRLNEDLVEAIGLGHDTGHTPFGHAGEEALDAALSDRFGGRFRHNEQSLRIAEALNLTHEVRDGILTHTGEQEPETLEGKIVRIVDRVAYINHDIDDAIATASSCVPISRSEIADPTGRSASTLLARPDQTSAREGDIGRGGRRDASARSFIPESASTGPGDDGRARAHRATVRRIFDASPTAVRPDRSRSSSPG
jgi:dGTPase